ncbi:MAG TPA: lipoyl(octanoyl) transferase LipB [Steroidobacteraceae bacterium]|nr:lipoyl(octanoyl) transferase LipB [Steroidobacteraceae bacterium]
MSAIARWLGRADYIPTWRAMQRFTDRRGAETPDELWCLEHPPVYTLGMNGDPSHVLSAGEIPVIRIDRGGQVTYHGPGQLVVYPLVDLRRRALGVRDLVTALEGALIAFAAEFGIAAVARRDAPGVYVEGRKLASIGLRIRRASSYHGLALNVAMNLAPFAGINPCGFANLGVVDLKGLGVKLEPESAAQRLVPHLWRTLRLPGEVRWDEGGAASRVAG